MAQKLWTLTFQVDYISMSDEHKESKDGIETTWEKLVQILEVAVDESTSYYDKSDDERIEVLADSLKVGTNH